MFNSPVMSACRMLAALGVSVVIHAAAADPVPPEIGAVKTNSSELLFVDIRTAGEREARRGEGYRQLGDAAVEPAAPLQLRQCLEQAAKELDGRKVTIDILRIEVRRPNDNAGGRAGAVGGGAASGGAVGAVIGGLVASVLSASSDDYVYVQIHGSVEGARTFYGRGGVKAGRLVSKSEIAAAFAAALSEACGDARLAAVTAPADSSAGPESPTQLAPTSGVEPAAPSP